MAIFNCDPAWPVCLFDFSFKSKIPSFLSFRVGHDLTSLIKEDYFTGTDQRESGKVEPDNALNMTSQNDLLIERNFHLCQNELFVSNFKNRFIANDPELLSNQHLDFFFEDETYI